MGKSNIHESHHLEATIDLINKMEPESVTIVIAGKLQRFSFWNSNPYSKWPKLSNRQLRTVIEDFSLKLTEEAIKRGIILGPIIY